jgi:Fur family peroxide stress response transcriptional regulator
MTTRVTPHLEAVFRAIDGPRDHPTAQRVFERVRQEIPSISLSTVYRNLEKLTRDGRLRMLRLESGVALYDAVEAVHDHFLCDVCGVVLDVDPESVGAAPDARLPGHSIRCRSTTLYGTCLDCSGEPAS